jgi:hypothetical protein
MADKAPKTEYHERGTVTYRWMGEFWEFTVKHDSGNTFIDAYSRLTDARRLVVTLIGKRTS